MSKQKQKPEQVAYETAIAALVAYLGTATTMKREEIVRERKRTYRWDGRPKFAHEWVDARKAWGVDHCITSDEVAKQVRAVLAAGQPLVDTYTTTGQKI